MRYLSAGLSSVPWFITWMAFHSWRNSPAFAFAFSPSPLSLRSTRPILRNGLLPFHAQLSPLTDDDDDSTDRPPFSNEDPSSPSNQNRRSFMTQSSTLAFLLTSQTFLTPLPTMATEPTSPPPPPNPNSKTIVITGCNSGIGFNAAYRMALSSTPTEPHTLILACRTLEKAQTAVRQIQTQMDAPNPYTTLIPKECDLADLSSIQSFVMDLKTSSSTISNPLDVVCYNAGLALNTAQTECVRTKDGFELTVGTNHLGHFYLNSLLLPMINPKTGRIVVTASGVHDPESPGGKQGNAAGLGSLIGFQEAVSQSTKKFDMIDGNPYDPDKAYKDSKLCNVLFTRELQKRLTASNSNIKAYCFSPGLIVETGFFRNQNPLFTKVMTIFGFPFFSYSDSYIGFQ